MLTHGIPPDFRGGVHLFIKNRHTPSGQSRVHGVTQLRTDGVHCRESVGTGPDRVVLKVVPVTCAAFLQVTMDQLICASLSHTHHWYGVGMLIVILHIHSHSFMLYYTILYCTRYVYNGSLWCSSVLPTYSAPQQTVNTTRSTTMRRKESMFEKRRLPASACLFSLELGVALSRTVVLQWWGGDANSTQPKANTNQT